MSTSRLTLEDGTKVNSIPTNYSGRITDKYNNKYWYQNGLHHRVDGPAWEYVNGDNFWFQNGLRHRVDGPAVEYANGTKHWYLVDQQITKTTKVVLICLQVGSP